MTLYDFREMAVDTYYNCYVYSNEKEENIFEGELNDIPEDLLDEEVTSWEIDNNRIGFNIDF